MPIQASPRFHIDAVGWGDGWGRDTEWLGDRLYDRGGRQDEVGERPGAGTLVSVGTGSNRVPIEPINRVPDVVSIVIPPPPPYVPPAPPGGTEPPQPVLIQVSWSDWMAAGNALPADWNSYPRASDHPDITGVTYEDTVVGSPPEDDTSILGDIYDLVDSRIGGILPGGTEPFWSGGVTNPGFPISGFVAPPTPVLNPAIVPAPGTTVAVTPGDTMQGMVYKKVCGQYKWVKQKRRRRRNLATKGDLKDLAALKGILGSGKAFEVWIATHS